MFTSLDHGPTSSGQHVAAYWTISGNYRQIVFGTCLEIDRI
jgi:hypothetical protein